MRKMRKKIAFSSIFVLSLALMTLAMPYITKMAYKSSASSDPEVGTISYYKADLFDYESSKRSSNGNFLLGEDEINNDTALFLFNQDNYYVKAEDFGQEVVPRPGEHNSWISAYKYKVVQGLVENSLNEDGTVRLANDRVAVSGNQAVNLFQTEDINTYMGAYSFPFENIGNGYLQYDSSKNHVQVTKELGEDGLLKMERYDMASSIGFMPFNKLDTSKGSDENGHYALSGSKNYYFGMKLELPFVMPKDGKIVTYNGSEEDMVFSFSGDDDLWVFVDGNLVLDLGGVHDAVSGTINFATGKVATKGNHYDEATGQYNKTVSSVVMDSSYINSLSVGRHTLQVFFLERGGAVSNCKITFRLQEDNTPDETPEPTPVVGPTKVPEEIPDITDSPVVTEQPVVTETPVVTEEPVVTEQPVVTETPVVTNQPATEATEVPVVTPTDNIGEGSLVETTESPTVAPTETIVETSDDPSYNKDSDIIDKPEVETDDVEDVDNDNDLSNNRPMSDVTNSSKDKESKGFTLFDSETPLGFLPKTGTVSEVVFYVVGALLVVVAVVMVVVTIRKKRK